MILSVSQRHVFLLLIVSMTQRSAMHVLLLLIVSMSQWADMHTASTADGELVNFTQRCGMYVVQEQPAFMVFSKDEQGGAALVRSILNRAVGAPQDAVKQVRHHTHVQEDKQKDQLCTTLRRGD